MFDEHELRRIRQELACVNAKLDELLAFNAGQDADTLAALAAQTATLKAGREKLEASVEDASQQTG